MNLKQVLQELEAPNNYYLLLKANTLNGHGHLSPQEQGPKSPHCWLQIYSILLDIPTMISLDHR